MNFLNRTASIIIVSLALLPLASCNSIKDIEYVGIKETKLQSIGIKKGTVKVILEYYNPNKFGLDIKETQLEVFINDKYIGIAENAEKNKIPKLAKFDFPIYVHFNPLQALGMAGLLNSKTVNLRVKGTAKAGKGGVFVRVPIEVTEVVNLKM